MVDFHLDIRGCFLVNIVLASVCALQELIFAREEQTWFDGAPGKWTLGSGACLALETALVEVGVHGGKRGWRGGGPGEVVGVGRGEAAEDLLAAAISRRMVSTAFTSIHVWLLGTYKT